MFEHYQEAMDLSEMLSIAEEPTGYEYDAPEHQGDLYSQYISLILENGEFASWVHDKIARKLSSSIYSYDFTLPKHSNEGQWRGRLALWMNTLLAIMESPHFSALQVESIWRQQKNDADDQESQEDADEEDMSEHDSELQPDRDIRAEMKDLRLLNRPQLRSALQRLHEALIPTLEALTTHACVHGIITEIEEQQSAHLDSMERNLRQEQEYRRTYVEINAALAPGTSEQLLEKLRGCGWNVASAIQDAFLLERDREQLTLNENSIHGYLRPHEVEALEELARTDVEASDTDFILDLTDKELRERLEQKSYSIRQELLDAFQTYHWDTYLDEQQKEAILTAIPPHYKIPRLPDPANGPDPTPEVVREVFDKMLRDYLILQDRETGGYHTRDILPRPELESEQGPTLS